MPASWAATAGAVRRVAVGSAGAPDAEGCWGASGLGLPAGEGGGVGRVGGPGCGPCGAAWEKVLACVRGSENGKQVLVIVMAVEEERLAAARQTAMQGS